jgi:hypothetical protein
LNHRLRKLICSLKFRSLEHSFSMAEEKSRSSLGPGNKVDVVPSSDRSHPDIVSHSLRHVTWHCQRVPRIFLDLLRGIIRSYHYQKESFT